MDTALVAVEAMATEVHPLDSVDEEVVAPSVAAVVAMAAVEAAASTAAATATRRSNSPPIKSSYNVRALWLPRDIETN